ncbi:CsbD family protein [Rhodopseudomonas sp.]|uniref:CsbD family protein n=1 Tax=Rhodopseudomonas sp. TaxID=1078 RepID=UPI003B3A51B2
MDKDRIEGKATELKGSIKEAIGKITGSDDLKAEGKADQLAGKAQAKVGEAKDAVKDALTK